MSLQHKMRFESGLLSIDATGEYTSLDKAKQLFLEMLEAVAQHQAKNVLLDGRTLEGKPRDFERFLYGEFAAKETLRLVKEHGIVPRFAYVLHEPLRDPGKFGETVAVNRGMNIKVFENLEDAFEWLGPDRPITPTAGA
jgi:hypothetical protein